jgi:Flp pilus assembly protein TadD
LGRGHLSKITVTPDEAATASAFGGVMATQEFRKLFEQGVAAAEQGNTLDALFHLESAARSGSSPRLTSYLGYCLAKERREFKRGADLCLEALKQEPAQAVHYLNLGRVYLAAGQKAAAIRAFRRGVKFGKSRTLIEQLVKLGIRKPPVVASLPRSHPVNRHLGLLFKRLGMR